MLIAVMFCTCCEVILLNVLVCCHMRYNYIFPDTRYIIYYPLRSILLVADLEQSDMPNYFA
jgi:hypothetical protein